MIYCDTGGSSPAAHDALAVFVSQARAIGLPLVVSEQCSPTELSAAHQFDFAPFISNGVPKPGDRLLLLAAPELTQSKANDLRAFARGTPLPCIAMGSFLTRQSEITVASRLAYALNHEPELLALNELAGFPPSAAPIFGAPIAVRKRTRPTVGLFFPDLGKPNAREAIRALDLAQAFDVEIITNGEEKKKWIDVDGHNVPVWHLGELLPRALAARFDAAFFFSKPVAWPRFQMLIANLVHSGAALIDATLDRSWHLHREEFIAGPVQISEIAEWFSKSIVPNRDAIAQSVTASPLARQLALPPALAAVKPKPPRSGKSRNGSSPTVLFVPTNGVGLGHAKRCSLIADAMRDRSAPKFGAFPSCVGMLTACGFDTIPLVSRTGKKASHRNDIVNFSRLSAAAAQSDVAVFDGGYVFDSVMRAAADSGRPSVWVRRGLWQASQNNQVALDRQKSFTSIVVPTEAFDELNAPVQRGGNQMQVGPIVQHTAQAPAQIAHMRETLQARFGVQEKTLVVTMLGGGVAADRRAQINTVCAHLEARSDVLHLLVVWPTATTDPGWFQYQNTRVVQSVHASVLLPVADLFISAIGYNSYHEAIYGQVPSIFIPQMASFMDDQRARGVAAADREIAILVEPWELLSLTRRIDECLDGHTEVLCKNLRGLNLPEPGARAAADKILEVAQ